MFAARGFFPGTQRVRNSRGKRAISVRATESLLYIDETRVRQFVFFSHTANCWELKFNFNKICSMNVGHSFSYE